MRVSIIILFSVFLWSGVLLDHVDSLQYLMCVSNSLLIYFVGTYPNVLFVCKRKKVFSIFYGLSLVENSLLIFLLSFFAHWLYTVIVASCGDKDHLGLCPTTERQFSGTARG